MKSNLVFIGSSTGGMRTLHKIFQGVPRLNTSVVIVQHMPRYINEAFRSDLDRRTKMTVVIARNGEKVQSGTIYIAPSEMHLKLSDNNSRISLYDGEKINYVKPSADVAMASLKKISGSSLIGIILTGMGRDGARGISYLKSIGAVTVAQSKETSSVFGMPKAAIATGDIDKIYSPDQIRQSLIKKFS